MCSWGELNSQPQRPQRRALSIELQERLGRPAVGGILFIELKGTYMYFTLLNNSKQITYSQGGNCGRANQLLFLQKSVLYIPYRVNRGVKLSLLLLKLCRPKLK